MSDTDPSSLTTAPRTFAKLGNIFHDNDLPKSHLNISTSIRSIQSKMTTTEETDVLIVGAGPTGLSLALELSAQKIPFLLVDKELVRSPHSKALITQSRSLEFLNRHGDLAHRVVGQGLQGFGIRIHVHKVLANEINLQDLGSVDTPFPLPLWISQAELEGEMEEQVKRYQGGRGIERGVSVSDVEQDGEGASAKLSGPEGRERRVKCKYIVGCDGAHSVVRHATGLQFDGAPYPQDFILCDTHIKWDQPPQKINIMWGESFCAAIPMKNGMMRLIASRGQTAEDLGDPTLEDFQKLVNEGIDGPVELYDPIWLTRFRLHRRGVENYRAGRLFMAGDAAHIHSPAGGQGMNTGIQDAVNLGWKFASVIRGEADDDLLDTYNDERQPVGRRILNRTDYLFSWSVSTHWLIRWVRNNFFYYIMPILTSDRGRRGKAFGFFSQLRIRYRRSSIVGTGPSLLNNEVRGGNRAKDGQVLDRHGKETFLLEDCRQPCHHLFFFAGESPDISDLRKVIDRVGATLEQRYKFEVRTHVVSRGELLEDAEIRDVSGELHRVYGLEKGGFVLVRPDLHVAYIGATVDEPSFHEYLENQASGR